MSISPTANSISTTLITFLADRSVWSLSFFRLKDRPTTFTRHYWQIHQIDISSIYFFDCDVETAFAIFLSSLYLWLYNPLLPPPPRSLFSFFSPCVFHWFLLSFSLNFVLPFHLILILITSKWPKSNKSCAFWPHIYLDFCFCCSSSLWLVFGCTFWPLNLYNCCSKGKQHFSVKMITAAKKRPVISDDTFPHFCRLFRRLFLRMQPYAKKVKILFFLWNQTRLSQAGDVDQFNNSFTGKRQTATR